jgi:hypothetical protein
MKLAAEVCPKRLDSIRSLLRRCWGAPQWAATPAILPDESRRMKSWFQTIDIRWRSGSRSLLTQLAGRAVRGDWVLRWLRT